MAQMVNQVKAESRKTSFGGDRGLLLQEMDG